jgi:trehalose-phosphatase
VTQPIPARRAARLRALAPDELVDRLPTRRPFLCLDYDGTLVPIARTPAQATCDERERTLLRRLSRRMPVAVVSGRALATLRSLVGVRSLIYVGNHGGEIAGPGFRHDIAAPRGWHRDLAAALEALEAIAPAGLLVERKGLTASVHYRLVAPGARRRWLRRAALRLSPWVNDGRVRVGHGQLVWELRPPTGWDKGRAVRWLLARPGLRGRVPVYVGDDTTDEDAFTAIRSIGIGIRVGPPRASAARYRLSDPAAVHHVLQRWLDAIEEPKIHVRSARR